MTGTSLVVVVVVLLAVTSFAELTTLFAAFAALFVHADVVALVLSLKVVVVAAATGVGESSAAARPRIEVPSGNDFETISTNRFQRASRHSLDS